MSKHILIIDDEENIRQMTRLTLETAGYEVGEAGSGMEAFAILGGDAFWDAVLLDQKMPGMAGTDVLRRIKVMAPQCRVIMMTAFASVELAVEGMRLGATDFVRKPTTPEILRNAVVAALDANRRQRADEERKTFTRNGFSILRTSVAAADALNERRFVVRRPDGSEQEVVVTISEEAISDVQNAGLTISLDDPFWTEEAEHFLGDFIWNDGNVPATGQLKLKGVEAADLAESQRQEGSNEKTRTDSRRRSQYSANDGTDAGSRRL